MVYLPTVAQNGTTVAENVVGHKFMQDVTTNADMTTFHGEDMTTTEHHRILEWLGEHELITLIFVGMFVIVTVLITTLYYIYKRSPCCRPCRKEKSQSQTKLTPNLSQVFIRPRDADRFQIERCDSDDSIKKF